MWSVNIIGCNESPTLCHQPQMEIKWDNQKYIIVSKLLMNVFAAIKRQATSPGVTTAPPLINNINLAPWLLCSNGGSVQYKRYLYFFFLSSKWSPNPTTATLWTWTLLHIASWSPSKAESFAPTQLVYLKHVGIPIQNNLINSGIIEAPVLWIDLVTGRRRDSAQCAAVLQPPAKAVLLNHNVLGKLPTFFG